MQFFVTCTLPSSVDFVFCDFCAYYYVNNVNQPSNSFLHLNPVLAGH